MSWRRLTVRPMRKPPTTPAHPPVANLRPKHLRLPLRLHLGLPLRWLALVALASSHLLSAQAQEGAPAPATAASTTAAMGAMDTAAELSFRDFFQLPIGPQGLEISPTLRQHQGQTVRLTGYMVQQENTTPGQFLFTPRPVQMSEHADGEADDLPASTVLVQLAPEQADWMVPHVRGRIALTGQLHVGRQEGRDQRITWVQLQLPAAATRPMSSIEMAGFMHALQHRH